MDRVFDNHVMNRMQAVVDDYIALSRQYEHATGWSVPGEGGAGYGLRLAGVSARARMAGPVGRHFTLADCAAAPSLFYADWVHEIGARRPHLKAYRARLLARPSVSRCVEDARPYRSYFPPGAPDRD
jgi:glutathione S-transferase